MNSMERTERFYKLIDEIVRAGVSIELSCSEGEIMVDLKTGMKSHCYLYLQTDDKVRIDRRYNRSEIFSDINLEEICERVADCHHGRRFYNGEWDQVLEDNGHPLNKEAKHI